MEHSLGFQLRHVELRQCDPVLERLHHADLKIGLLQEAQGVRGVPTHEQEVYQETSNTSTRNTACLSQSSAIHTTSLLNSSRSVVSYPTSHVVEIRLKALKVFF